jgi:hypothetical protein
MSVSNFFDLRGPQLSTAQGAISSLARGRSTGKRPIAKRCVSFFNRHFFSEYRNKIGVMLFVDDLRAAAVTVIPGCAVQPNRTGTVLTLCAFEM